MAAAVWPWKRAICANHRQSVDKHKPFIVISGSFLPLFFGPKDIFEIVSRNHLKNRILVQGRGGAEF
jgi:hypothetical protein